MTKFCTLVDIHDVITCATFCDDRLRGLGVARGRISSFPIDVCRRPYNILALPCECVMINTTIVHQIQTASGPSLSALSDYSCQAVIISQCRQRTSCCYQIPSSERQQCVASRRRGTCTVPQSAPCQVSVHAPALRSPSLALNSLHINIHTPQPVYEPTKVRWKFIDSITSQEFQNIQCQKPLVLVSQFLQATKTTYPAPTLPCNTVAHLPLCRSIVSDPILTKI